LTLVTLAGKLVAWRLRLEVGSKALKLDACRLELDACRLQLEAAHYDPRDSASSNFGRSQAHARLPPSRTVS